MSIPSRVNDHSSAPPRLAIYGNEWAMLELPKLPHDRSWSFEETADKMVAAGFHGIQTQATHKRILDARNLRFATSGRANTPEEIDAHIHAAADAGADCTTMHVGWGMESDTQIDALADAVLNASAKHDLPAYIETHRATIAQDTWRITQLIARRPDLRFNGDFSHLYCGGEVTYPGFDAFRHHFEPILHRICFIHGRVSNGQSMQVDIGDDRNNSHVNDFTWLWERAMRFWLTGAKSGDILPFAPELGPPSFNYSITYLAPTGQLVEVSDRWEQTLVMKRLAEECWNKATLLTVA